MLASRQTLKRFCVPWRLSQCSSYILWDSVYKAWEAMIHFLFLSIHFSYFILEVKQVYFHEINFFFCRKSSKMQLGQIVKMSAREARITWMILGRPQCSTHSLHMKNMVPCEAIGILLVSASS